MQSKRAPRGDLFDVRCPTRDLLDRVGGKWTAMLVKLLDEAGERRFSELSRGAAGISRKMLASTLRDLERDGLVSRRVQPTTPPSVYYELTPLGRSLSEPLATLRNWAESNMRAVDDARIEFDRRS
ncbi:HxlR family transcriptional regulator [Mycolicibacterium neoaurum]|nr:HxlR family transcriptional regulator [Mycolicibacterium neoaurum]